MALLNRPVTNECLLGEIETPQSAAVLQRYLILNAVSRNPQQINVKNRSGNITSIRKALLDLNFGGTISNAGKFAYRVDLANNGPGYKLLVPVAAAFNKNCIYGISGEMAHSSMDQFFRVLRTHGVRREVIRPDLVRITGQLTAGTFILPGNTDGQILSGLLMALPCLKENSTVMVEKLPEAQYEVELTLEIMGKAGVQVEVTEDHKGFSRVYRITGGQQYDMLPVTVQNNDRVMPKAADLTADRDWNLAAYWLTGAVVGASTVTCTGMNLESLQEDKYIAGILKAFGAEVSVDKKGNVTASSGDMQGLDIDITECPGLVPLVMLTASVSRGTSVIRNASNSIVSRDNVDRMVTALKKIGANINIDGDDVIIQGSGGTRLAGGRPGRFSDPSIIMTLAIASCACEGSVIIENADIVSRVYPEFFDELERLKTTGR